MWTVDGMFLRSAYLAAAKSNHPRTQMGAAIWKWGHHRMEEVATGCNEVPPRIDSQLYSPDSTVGCEHAERAAIYRAAFLGQPTKDCLIACPWGPCVDCSRAIIASGITLVLLHKQAMKKMGDKWRQSVDAGIKLLEEAAGPPVRVEVIDTYIGQCLRLNGELVML